MKFINIEIDREHGGNYTYIYLKNKYNEIVFCKEEIFHYQGVCNYYINIQDLNIKKNHNSYGYGLKVIDNTGKDDGPEGSIKTHFWYNGILIGYLKNTLHPTNRSFNPKPNMICFKSIKHWRQYVKLQVFK